MSILKKVKKFFGFNSGEDEPNYPIVETQKASNGSKRGESKEESIIKTPIQEVNEAIEKYKKLISDESGLITASDELYEKLIYSRVKYPLIKERNVGKLYLELIIVDYLPQMKDIIEDLYEEDESILEKSNEDTTIEKIKKKSTKESMTTIEQSIKERIFELIESKDIAPDRKITTDEFVDELVDSFIISMFRGFKSLYKIQSEIVPEKMGIRYALIRALNPDVVLPKKLNGIYEDADDYRKKEKASIIHNLTECIRNATFTPTERKVETSRVKKGIIEAKALMGGNVDLEGIKKLNSDDIAAGRVNPNATKLERDKLNKVKQFLEKGIGVISEENKTNKMFIYEEVSKSEKTKKQNDGRDESIRTLFLEGEYVPRDREYSDDGEER